MSVKIRKIGNLNFLTVPESIMPLAQEYYVFQGRDGVIVYTPAEENPFTSDKFIKQHDFSQTEEFSGPMVGKEIINDQ
ncbi:antitoxin of toxin-antitoxin stability system [Companilactobacillus mishanensis]|uniref:antitoxin of toxin-antitoxin stability system n=1 Tax=Companilactobacillus mishanensis TaxID=2486008 RepID=UPI001295DA4B|nr:antitoxin of toxin-antitoxin stability system [Companilactobacillus mishanensis]MQS89605.1 antitoxin of toxin-antitoxin stability system [Companilactobacillus mishanensis]